MAEGGEISKEAISNTTAAQSGGETGRQQLSRRDFLRVAALGIFGLAASAVGCAAPPPAPQPRPEAAPTPDMAEAAPTSEPQRFFEDIDTFNPDKTLPVLNERLASFAATFGPAIERHLGTDRQELAAAFADSIIVLRRIYEGNRFLKRSTDPVLQSHAEVARDDFYEMGSAIYALDLAYETFKDKPEQFEQCIQRYAGAEYSSMAGYSDMLIGDRLFTMNAAWTDLVPGFFPRNSQQEQRYFSPVIELVAPQRTGSMEVHPGSAIDKKPTPGVVRLMNKEPLITYPPEIGVENLPGVRLESVDDEEQQQEGITADMRQKKAELVGFESAAAKRYVEELMQKHRLERITPIIQLLNLPYGGIFMTSGPLRLLQLQKRLFEEDNYRKYPAVTERITLHEFGHALRFAVNYLPPEEYQEVKARIDAVLEGFRPYASMTRLFSPPDDDASVAVSFGAELGELNEMAKVINWSTVTNYSAKEYVKTNWSIALNEHESSGVAHETQELLDVLSMGMPDGWLTAEVHAQDQERIYPSFAQFLEKFTQNPPQAPLGVFILDAIRKNAGLFAVSVIEQDYGYGRLDGANVNGAQWMEHWQQEVIPATVAQLVKDTPEDFLAKATESMVTDTGLDEARIKHAIALYRRKLKMVEQFADHELFADVFADTLRRNDADINLSTTIPSSRWEQMDALIDDILGRLKIHGLAHNVNPTQMQSVI